MISNSTISSLGNSTELVDFYAHDTWDLPLCAVIFSIVHLSINIVFGFLTNALLMLIIYNSPSLRTPPNTHLVNISINNITLCFCMLLSLTSVSLKGKPEEVKTLAGVQLFMITNSLLQYLCTFASIGLYRIQTIKRPSLPLKVRKRLVSRSVTGGWLVTCLLSLMYCLSFSKYDNILSTTLSPFQRTFSNDHGEAYLTVEQLSVVGIIIIAFLSGLLVIFVSYYNICKALDLRGPLSKNKIGPWNRNLSFSSDATVDFQFPIRNYTPEPGHPKAEGGYPKLFMVSGEESDGVIVHYHKSEHTLAFEDIFALENPILANRRNQMILNKRPLQKTLSNTSTSSTRTRNEDFTDISPSADLQRVQNLKNKTALRKQNLRRDRIYHSSAAKNSMVMLVAFLTSSLPMFICTVPSVLRSLENSTRLFVLLGVKLTFYLNACIYPTWYLIFSKRVRKCMFRMFESIYLRLNSRR